jgi:Protein of unknown function (DUF664).
MKFQLEQAIEILSQTPETVRSLLGNLSEDWTSKDGARDNWSAFDVVGHYIHAEETNWIPRARVILAQNADRTFAPFDRFGHFEKSKGKTLHELLETFAERRKESLQTLRSWNLTDEQLDLKAVHPELGEINLRQLLSTWVVHDLTHIRQIVTFLAKKYSSEVGVWREYLSILK